MKQNQQRKKSILSRLKGGQAQGKNAEYDQRINAKPVVIEDTKQFFLTQLEKAQCSAVSVNQRNELPKAVADFLTENSLPLKIQLSEDNPLRKLPWQDFGVDVSLFQRADVEQQVLLQADYGIAETGTLVCLPSAFESTSSRFLCSVQIILVEESSLVNYYEDFWRVFRQNQSQDGGMPRVINWITGPSRTADIEQTLQLGAHGAQKVLVVLETAAG